MSQRWLQKGALWWRNPWQLRLVPCGWCMWNGVGNAGHARADSRRGAADSKVSASVLMQWEAAAGFPHRLPPSACGEVLIWGVRESTREGL